MDVLTARELWEICRFHAESTGAIGPLAEDRMSVSFGSQNEGILARSADLDDGTLWRQVLGDRLWSGFEVGLSVDASGDSTLTLATAHRLPAGYEHPGLYGFPSIDIEVWHVDTPVSRHPAGAPRMRTTAGPEGGGLARTGEEAWVRALALLEGCPYAPLPSSVRFVRDEDVSSPMGEPWLELWEYRPGVAPKRMSVRLPESAGPLSVPCERLFDREDSAAWAAIFACRPRIVAFRTMPVGAGELVVSVRTFGADSANGAAVLTIPAARPAELVRGVVS